MEIRKYQLEAVYEILEKKRVLINDEMTLGKCAESILPINIIGGKTLIACPYNLPPHWEDEIKLWYKDKEDTKITRITTESYRRDINNAKNSDFVIITHPQLSWLGKNRYELNMLEDLGFKTGILDEAHNEKNPESLRSTSAREIFHNIEYMVALTGTPIPNTVIDIYCLLNLVDKEKFPIFKENPAYILNNFYRLFKQDPGFVRKIINERMIRRTIKDYLHTKVPKINHKIFNVQLDGEHLEVYKDIYENNSLESGQKLIYLNEAALDPNLVPCKILSPSLAKRIGKMESSVYKSLDGLIEKIMDEKGKVLIFSNLRDGVTDYLKYRLNKYNPLIIDGKENTDVDKREEIRKEFNKNPNKHILITTTVMSEGTDLTGATDTIHLTQPFTPAEFDQKNRRSARYGDVKKESMNVWTIKSKVNDLISTVTEGIERAREDKARIINFIYSNPFSLTKEDLEEVKNGSAHKSRNISPLITHPINAINKHLGLLKNSGHEKILAHYRKYPQEAEYFAKIYANYWEGNYGGNTANVYKKVIELLKQKEDLERKLDVASGPFSLSRKIKEPVINLDLNEHMFEAGRILENEGKIVQGNEAIKGVFNQLPFKPESFDLLVCANSLHLSKLNLRNGVREREEAIREANRVLRNGGHYIITLPYNKISQNNFNSFYEALDALGFETLPFSGFYKGRDNPDFKVYLATLKKVKEASQNPVKEGLLAWKMDEDYNKKVISTSKEKKDLCKTPQKFELKPAEDFYNTSTGTSLEESVNKCINKKA